VDPIAASQTSRWPAACRNVKRLKARRGDAIGIIRLGAVGLMTAQLLKNRSAPCSASTSTRARREPLAFGLGVRGPRTSSARCGSRPKRGLDVVEYSPRDRRP